MVKPLPSPTASRRPRPKVWLRQGRVLAVGSTKFTHVSGVPPVATIHIFTHVQYQIHSRITA